MDRWSRGRDWLLPVVLILFLLEILLFPYVTGLTYAGRSDSPDHILTYTTGSLTWDSATGIDENGVAELNLFDSVYQNVQSQDGDKVVAPGTEQRSIVRLKNQEDYPIQYVAVMYRIKEEAQLPVEPTLTGSTFTDTLQYPLPDGVEENQVVRAVTGTVDGGQLQDFDIAWLWNYYDSDQRDQVDTALGNQAAFGEPDEVTAGLYIVVTEENAPGNPDDPEDPQDPDDDPDDPDDPYVRPDAPKTGDDSGIVMYSALLAVSGVVLVLLILDRRRERRK